MREIEVDWLPRRIFVGWGILMRRNVWRYTRNIMESPRLLVWATGCGRRQVRPVSTDGSIPQIGIPFHPRHQSIIAPLPPHPVTVLQQHKEDPQSQLPPVQRLPSHHRHSFDSLPSTTPSSKSVQSPTKTKTSHLSSRLYRPPHKITTPSSPKNPTTSSPSAKNPTPRSQVNTV